MSRSVLGFCLVALLAACSDGATSPRAIVPDSVAVVSIDVSRTSDDFLYQYFGTGTDESNPFNTGMAYVKNDGKGYPAILKKGELAAISIEVNSALGIVSTATNKGSFWFSSDWQAVDAKQHRGIVLSDSSTVVFDAEGLEYSPDGNVGNWLPSNMYTKKVRMGSVSVKLDLPAEVGAMRFVLPRQIYRIGCSKTDSVSFRTMAGIAISQTTPPSSTQATTVIAAGVNAGVMTVHCDVYENASMAKSALGAEILRSMSLTGRTAPRFEVRNGWMSRSR